MIELKNDCFWYLEIDEGEEVVVRSIRFNGNSAFEDDDLSSEFDETVQDAWWRFWSSANLKKKILLKTKNCLKRFIKKMAIEILKSYLTQ